MKKLISLLLLILGISAMYASKTQGAYGTIRYEDSGTSVTCYTQQLNSWYNNNDQFLVLLAYNNTLYSTHNMVRLGFWMPSSGNTYSYSNLTGPKPGNYTIGPWFRAYKDGNNWWWGCYTDFSAWYNDSWYNNNYIIGYGYEQRLSVLCPVATCAADCDALGNNSNFVTLTDQIAHVEVGKDNKIYVWITNSNDVETIVIGSPIEYDITFNNYDGTQLQKSKVAKYSTPEYTGATPTKQTGWHHTGWTPTITEVSGDKTYRFIANLSWFYRVVRAVVV